MKYSQREPNYEIGVELFLRKPQSAMIRGYLPDYATCCAWVLSQWWRPYKALWVAFAEFKSLFDMRLWDIGYNLLVLVGCILFALTFPVVWPLVALMMRINSRKVFEHHQAQQRRLDELLDI